MHRKYNLSSRGIFVAGFMLFVLTACGTVPSGTIVKTGIACHLSGGDLKQRVAACEYAIHSHSYTGARLADLYFMEAIHLQALGKDAEAVASFNQAIRLNPRDTKSYYYRSLSLLKLGQYAAAQHDFDLAHRLN